MIELNERIEYIKMAEKFYREFLSVRMNLYVIDKLTNILRNTGRWDEASFWTIKACNLFPNYYAGWVNLGAYEIESKRFETAKMFLERALKIKPDYKEAQQNLRMIKEYELAKKQGRTK